MKKNTPTKKKSIKAHRGTIVYEPMRGGGGRPQIPRPFPRPFPGRPRPFPRPFPGLPRPRPIRPEVVRPSPFVSGPPRRRRRGPQIDPRRGTPVSFPIRLPRGSRFAQPISKQARDMR